MESQYDAACSASGVANERNGGGGGGDSGVSGGGSGGRGWIVGDIIDESPHLQDDKIR